MLGRFVALAKFRAETGIETYRDADGSEDVDRFQGHSANFKEKLNANGQIQKSQEA